MVKKFFDENSDYFYFAFRVIFGLVFLLHGISKLGIIESGSLSLMWFAGIIEILVGSFIILGLFVRYAALLGALEMLYVFVMVHIVGSGTLNPLVNKGEPALLFLAAFIVILADGARKWSLSNLIFSRGR